LPGGLAPTVVLAFSVAPGSGALAALGDVDSGGQGPVHIAIDRDGRWLLVAHYTSGDVAVLAIRSDGTLDPTPVDVEPVGDKAHQIVVDPSNHFVFVPCVGANHVAQLVLEPERGTLEPNRPGAVSSTAGAGPRHLVLHPEGNRAYVVDETGSTITAYDYDAANGTLTRQASVDMLPDGFNGDSFGGEIAVSPDGRFVYASSRGHDSIAVFAVGAGGALMEVDRTPTGGTFPRSSTFTPDGSRLIVANQTANNLVQFAVDPRAGMLSPLAPLATAAAPFFVGTYTIPAR
jgi:6-phosphogluconolactonase